MSGHAACLNFRQLWQEHLKSGSSGITTMAAYFADPLVMSLYSSARDIPTPTLPSSHFDTDLIVTWRVSRVAVNVGHISRFQGCDVAYVITGNWSLAISVWHAVSYTAGF